MFSNKLVLIILLVLIVSCKHNKKLTITDLHFPDYDRKKILENHIDTTYVLNENCHCIEIIGVNHYMLEDYFTGYIVYNKKGLATEIYKEEIMGTQIRYRYDSLDLPIHKVHMTDFDAAFKAKYLFDADSNILKQIWYAGNEPYDTCLFKFNSNGQLIESEEYANDDHGQGRHFFTKYEYTQNGQLAIKYYKRKYSDQLWLEKELGIPLFNEYRTQYYYSNAILDSAITHFIYQTNPKWNYLSKTYYNKLGLRTKKIDRDTTITLFIHK